MLIKLKLKFNKLFTDNKQQNALWTIYKVAVCCKVATDVYKPLQMFR